MFFATKNAAKIYTEPQWPWQSALLHSLSECGDAEGWCRVELETKVHTKVSLSRRRPLLWHLLTVG